MTLSQRVEGSTLYAQVRDSSRTFQAYYVFATVGLLVLCPYKTPYYVFAH